MSTAYDGITLNKLILSTRKLFTSIEEQDAFLSKVAMQGYEYNTYYDDFVYEISSFKVYEVNQHFPKLTKNTIPVAISKASYEIALVEIASFEIKD
jgi:hypothetical protein